MSSPTHSTIEGGHSVDGEAVNTQAAVEVPTTRADEPMSSSSSPPLSPDATHANLAPLRALFPSTSDDILDAVLEAHSGNLQAATETLLDMNNPEFKDDHVQHGELEQVDLDAELARQLAEEDQLQYRQQRAQRQQSQPNQQSHQQQAVPLTYQAYVPKRKRATTDGSRDGHGTWAPPTAGTSQTQQRGPAREEDERDELDVLAENFSKLAEQGKKSFGSFMSKMKEQVGRIDDLIQQSASPSSADRPPQPPPKPASSANFGSPRTGAQWTAPEPLPRPANAPPRTSSLITPRDTLHRQDTNDSFTIGDDNDPSPNPSPQPRQPHTPAESIDSYFKDFDNKTAADAPITINRNDTPASETKPASPGASADAEERHVSEAADSTPSPTIVPAPKDPRKDFSKIGLLPRRSVSLLDDDKLHRSSSSAGNERVKSPLAHPSEKKPDAGNESDDSDELEYVKNPFDEE
ncbi:uncharacterized protein JCM15063_000634 [Sporobolomyces koalae]|uniref:uncharacterized protein n=1 Tax=Sporobolomyces koalae TaxID=500713 RepID=UPI00317BB7DC